MKYHHEKIEAKWQQYWAQNQTFAAKQPCQSEPVEDQQPKYYVLDMFPYPSGAGLHVGHPLGYIASDIVARFKRHKGFNVLHPQGYDSFGLPAEQYAIQTGQHPEKTTRENIARYREQLDKIGFSFDWSREVRTSNPDYYKHTQWIFIQLFNSWYNNDTNKAEDIATLIAIFEKEGNATVNAVCDDNITPFSAAEWNAFSSDEQQKILLQYRLTYLAETEVNWCPALGTVLANDEIVNGVSERGGHPVIRKKMTQWSMRISAYAERLLQGLDTIDWSESIKESQRNWIGKSVGAMVKFQVQNPQPATRNSELFIDVFTTRPDTIFGVTFMTLAPEHELVAKITTPEQKAAVEAYVEATAKRSERERMADVKTISGVFTGAYAEHPFTKEPIPVWIGDYVLAGYGTGAVMAVPCGDERDYAFANFFKGQNGMPEIKNIFNQDISQEAFAAKEGFQLVNSDFLNGLGYKEGTKKAIEALEQIGQGKGKTNYRLRDAVFSRQRYWGEPFPVYYVNGLPQMIDPKYLPIVLPEVEKYLPTEDGQPPLGNATDWAWDTVANKVVSNEWINHQTVFPLELNTMPGWAGSSWYWMRYMDAHNNAEFASADALKYWENVDLYIGGSEHATGHLLYSRFWNKFLKDKGFAPTEEPFKKLINQGMILGMSAFVYRWEYGLGRGNEGQRKPVFISKNLIDKAIKEKAFISDVNEEAKTVLDRLVKMHGNVTSTECSWNHFTPLHVDLAVINDITNELDIEAFKNHPLYSDYKDAEFILENGKYIVGREVEKMSKSKYNVVNPDDICEQYGADTLRLYEMFLGPLEQAKPWNTAGITGVSGFLKKLWRLYFDDNGLIVTNEEPTADMYKSLHKTIKKVTEDIENFSFNTSVSQFMICVNELASMKCHHRAILEPLAVLISPYAPHIAEELWEQLGHQGSVSTVPFPVCEEKYLVESEKEYPVSFNGKMRFTIKLPLDLTVAQIEEIVISDERTKNQLNNNLPDKIIIVPGKVINLVGIKKNEMSTKEIFITSYLDRIENKFNVSKDYAFEIFSIAAILEKGFDDVYNNIRTNGSRDGGIDGVYFEQLGTNYIMHVFQCKNSSTLKQNEIEKFKNDVNDIFIRGLDKPNSDDIKDKIEEHKSLTQNGFIIEPKLYFVYNGYNEDKDRASNIEMYKAFNGSNNNLEIWDSVQLFNKINSLIKAQNRREEIKFVFNPIESNVIYTDNQALYTFSINNVNAANFRMKASDLCRLVDLEIEKNKTYEFLFSENIRSFLSYKSKANKNMRSTLENSEEAIYFPFLNNGITIICDNLKLPSNSQQGIYNIDTTNPLIVNGLQTTRILYDIYKDDPTKIDKVFVNVRLYQTDDPNLVDRITDATNTQTPISFKDKISNKSFNELTKEFFENKGVNFITKRGEVFDPTKNKFNETVQSETVLKFWYATFYERPEVAKNSIASVLEEIFDASNNENPLSVIFNGDNNSPIYNQLFFSYKIYKYVVSRRKENLSYDFIKYADELMAYGIYKEFSYYDLQTLDNEIQSVYTDVFDTVNEIVASEFEKYSNEGRAFSYNNYFKTPKCRIQYNEKKDIFENDDILRQIKTL